MSKNVAVFVDVANLYYSARGQDVDVDYVALLKTATKGRDLIRAYAYSGLDPENENQRKFIDFLGKNGYKVLTKDIRKFGDGRVKANLDIELVVDLFRLADRMDIAVIVSGDGDFAPAIRALQDQGVRCEVISFRPNTSSDLIAVADEFIDVMKIAGIGRGSKEARAQRGMSAPEMPAKEVVPEFGFREASPSVAKAALAAIRGDGRGRGRGRAAATDEAVEEPVAATGDNGAAVAESEGDGRRRRRRRGGRGRGRGRGRAEQGAETPEAPEATGEIGWTELDDLSEIDDVSTLDGPETGREYTFEEADEATLAELGLLDGTDRAAPKTPEPEEAPAKKPASRRGRARKADVATASDGAGEPVVEAPKKPRRTRTTKKADASDASEAGEGEPAAKPARRSRAASASKTSPRGTRGRKAASDTAEPAETETEAKPSRRRSRASAAQDQASAAGSDQVGEQGQGIWSRFRSARGTTRPS